ncbi:MAG: isopentenyl-diphosphate Delta-isomerase [Pseudomonadota bacterium]
MNDALETVIVVDRDDTPIRSAGKLDVHFDGTLHRAFSVFGFNKAGEMLIQKRAECKYHSPGLWANTCCGHPRPGEATLNAAVRRTREELGIQVTLRPAFQTCYKADVGRGLIEHEFVHAYSFVVNDLPRPNPYEISEVNFLPLKAIVQDVKKCASSYASWFKFYVENHLEDIIQMSKTEGSLTLREDDWCGC